MASSRNSPGAYLTLNRQDGVRLFAGPWAAVPSTLFALLSVNFGTESTPCGHQVACYSALADRSTTYTRSFRLIISVVHSYLAASTLIFARILTGAADPGSPPSTTNKANTSNSTTNRADYFLSTPNPLSPSPQDLLARSQVTHHLAQEFPPSISPSLPPSPIATSPGHHHLADTTTPNTATKVSQPIQIPTVTLPRRDPGRVPTPVSARGERKGHFFPYSRTPSPHPPSVAYSPSRLSHSSPDSDDFPSGWARGRRRSSSSSRSHHILSMHSEQYSGRYMPTSPLSPKIPSSSRPLSPQPANLRPGHNRQTSRNLHMTLPRYHPAHFQHHASAATSTSSVQSPAITINKVNQPVQMDSPRMMREKQRELLDTVRISSMIAASPAGQKPVSPRLDPLGSPKGPVTPLALEEPTDYFSVTRTGKRSPAASPGAKSHRSSRSDTSSGKEEGNAKNKRKVDVYQ